MILTGNQKLEATSTTQPDPTSYFGVNWDIYYINKSLHKGPFLLKILRSKTTAPAAFAQGRQCVTLLGALPLRGFFWAFL